MPVVAHHTEDLQQKKKKKKKDLQLTLGSMGHSHLPKCLHLPRQGHPCLGHPILMLLSNPGEKSK